MKWLLAIGLFSFMAIAFGQAIHREIPVTYASETETPVQTLKDKRGFLWIVTDEGVYFFDGIEATKKIQSPHSLSCAAFSEDGGIWTGSVNGNLTKFNPETGTKKIEYQLPDSVEISHLTVDSARLLISTSGEGIFILEDGNLTQIKTQLSDHFVYSTAVETGLIYVATDRGVEVLDAQNRKVRSYPATGITTSLLASNQNLTIGGFSNGIFQIDISSKKLLRVTRSLSEVAKIKSIGNDLIILSQEGLHQLDNPKKEPVLIFEGEELIDFEVMNSTVILALDENGNLFSIDLHFSRIDIGLEENVEITCIHHRDSILYLGTNEAIYSYNIYTGFVRRSSIDLTKGLSITCMAATKENLYVGTFNQGIFSLNLSSGKISSFNNKSGLQDNSVLAFELIEDTLWFSTLSGLAFLTPKSAPTYIPKENFPFSTYIYALHGYQGKLFLGTDGKGVIAYDGYKASRPKELVELADATVFNFCMGSRDDLWMISKESGIYFLSDNQLSTSASLQSLEYGGFPAFGCTSDGSVIILSEGKLILAQPELKMVLSDESSFGELTGGFLNTVTTTGNGLTYFASGNEVYAYHPRGRLVVPEIALVSWETNFQNASRADTIIDFDRNNCVFILGSPWYRNQENLSFRYRLKGLEEEFKTTVNQELVYPNLPPGSYSLEAQVGFNGVFYGEPSPVHAFRIVPPIYRRPWFIAVMLIALLISIYTIFRLRVAAIDKIRLAEQKLLESELAVLRTQVNPHFLFNSFNTLMNIIETHPGQATEYLEKLSDFYRRLLADDKKQVVSLNEELAILREYLFLQKKRFGNSLQLNESLNIEDSNVLIPALTLQLLAENAIKHNVISISNKLEIDLYSEGNYLIFKNSRKEKITPAEGLGIGLENISQRYQSLFGKEVKIEKTELYFIVKLPLIYGDSTSRR